jgi:cytochrome c peroxidase
MKKYFFLLVFIFSVATISFIAPVKKPNTFGIAQLGEKLFFDNILSGDNTISCASCHKPAFAFADTVAFSIGVNGFKTKRNTPSVMNMASRESLFWDGRAKSLEDQVLFPISDPHEMNLPIDIAIKRLNENKDYVLLFQKIFKQNPDTINLEQAIAAFEKTLETSNTPNDRWLNDKPKGLSKQQIKGRSIFFNKGKCIECHFTPDFTGDEFRNIGTFDGNKYNDSGRYLITKKIADIGKFKVPGLRNASVTAPYMHDGRFKTMRAVINFYNTPKKFISTNAIGLDSLLQKPLHLTKTEITDLISFLNAMTDDKFLNRK